MSIDVHKYRQIELNHITAKTGLRQYIHMFSNSFEWNKKIYIHCISNFNKSCFFLLFLFYCFKILLFLLYWTKNFSKKFKVLILFIFRKIYNEHYHSRFEDNAQIRIPSHRFYIIFVSTMKPPEKLYNIFLSKSYSMFIHTWKFNSVHYLPKSLDVSISGVFIVFS